MKKHFCHSCSDPKIPIYLKWGMGIKQVSVCPIFLDAGLALFDQVR